MLYNVRLETSTGHFVAATRFMFQTLPTVILWGDRCFVLYEAGTNSFPSRYRERFCVAAVEVSDVDPQPQLEPLSPSDVLEDAVEALRALLDYAKLVGSDDDEVHQEVIKIGEETLKRADLAKKKKTILKE